MKKIIALGCASLTLQTAYAESQISIQSFPTEQFNHVVKTIVNDFAPWGTSVKNQRVDGYVVLDDDGYLSEVVVSPVSFEASFLFFKSKTRVTMHAYVNRQCNAAQVQTVEVTGTNSTIDNAIRSKFRDQAENIVINYIVGLTDLKNYCDLQFFYY